MVADGLVGIDGRRIDPAVLDGKAVLVVNVASRCGLTAVADSDGRAGEVEWNFEKFLISPAGEVVARFRPAVEPEDDLITGAIERVLP